MAGESGGEGGCKRRSAKKKGGCGYESILFRVAPEPSSSIPAATSLRQEPPPPPPMASLRLGAKRTFRLVSRLPELTAPRSWVDALARHWDALATDGSKPGAMGTSKSNRTSKPPPPSSRTPGRAPSLDTAPTAPPANRPAAPKKDEAPTSAFRSTVDASFASGFGCLVAFKSVDSVASSRLLEEPLPCL